MKKKTRRPKPNRPETVNLTDLKVVELEEIRVNEFHPEPDGRRKPTQVHLTATPKGRPDVAIIMRFKSRRSLDQLVAALEHHADRVFGKPS